MKYFNRKCSKDQHVTISKVARIRNDLRNFIQRIRHEPYSTFKRSNTIKKSIKTKQDRSQEIHVNANNLYKFDNVLPVTTQNKPLIE